MIVFRPPFCRLENLKFNEFNDIAPASDAASIPCKGLIPFTVMIITCRLETIKNGSVLADSFVRDLKTRHYFAFLPGQMW